MLNAAHSDTKVCGVAHQPSGVAVDVQQTHATRTQKLGGQLVADDVHQHLQHLDQAEDTGVFQYVVQTAVCFGGSGFAFFHL